MKYYVQKKLHLTVWLFHLPMAKEFAKQFYSSKQWQNARESYAKEQRYLCENCLRNGLISAGEIVHHKTELTPENINDPDITLNPDNLEMLCRRCHSAVHNKKRFSILADGTVAPLF